MEKDDPRDDEIHMEQMDYDSKKVILTKGETFPKEVGGLLKSPRVLTQALDIIPRGGKTTLETSNPCSSRSWPTGHLTTSLRGCNL